MGNRKNRSGRDGLPPFVNPDFADALSGRRDDSFSRERQKDDRKARQLCRQVYQVLSLALAGECGDDVLRELTVESVEPAPNVSRLLVRVALPSAGPPLSPIKVLERLDRVRGLLRQRVARAITRKRAPELIFMPVAPGSEVRP